MEQEGTDTDSPKADAPAAQNGAEAHDGHNDTASSGGSSTHAWTRREPTVLTLQDLIDLPRQILPEETYIHLRNAFREASLAAFSLWRSVDKARKGTKVRTHIDIE